MAVTSSFAPQKARLETVENPGSQRDQARNHRPEPGRAWLLRRRGRPRNSWEKPPRERIKLPARSSERSKLEPSPSALGDADLGVVARLAPGDEGGVAEDQGDARWAFPDLTQLRPGPGRPLTWKPGGLLLDRTVGRDGENLTLAGLRGRRGSTTATLDSESLVEGASRGDFRGWAEIPRTPGVGKGDSPVARRRDGTRTGARDAKKSGGAACKTGLRSSHGKLARSRTTA